MEKQAPSLSTVWSRLGREDEACTRCRHWRNAEFDVGKSYDNEKMLKMFKRKSHWGSPRTRPLQEARPRVAQKKGGGRKTL